MKKYLLKNVSRNPKYADRRRAYPLHVTKAPTVAGKRIFPKIVLELSESEIFKDPKSVENLIKAGVITLCEVGGPSEIQKLSEEPIVEEAPAPEPVKEVLVVDTVDVVSEPIQAEPDPDIPEEPSSLEIEEVVEEEEEDSAGYTEEELTKMKNAELRELLSILDPDFPSGGVKKADLVSAILEKQ